MSTIYLLAGIGGIFLAIFLSLTAIGVFTNEARGVSKSLAVVEAFTSAPKALTAELDPSFNDRVLTPLVDRFVGLGKKFTPSDHAERIRHKLDVAGNPAGLTVDRITSMKFLGFAGALVLSVMISLGLGLGIGPMLAVCVGAA